MLFSEILGLDHIKNHLTTSADRGRIPHAQLFVGSHGSGTLAMAVAYARYILCQTAEKKSLESGIACAKSFDKLIHHDLHFCYPSANNKRITSKARALDFLKEWREFLLEKPYCSFYYWYMYLGLDYYHRKICLNELKVIVIIIDLYSF